MAIVLAVVASGCFALGATCQHLGVDKNFAKEGATDRAMTFKRLLRLLATPLWIGGLALVGTGAALHIVALKMAPLTVIQPVGILAVPFSILLANRIFHTKTTSKMWTSVAITVAGIVAFTVLSAKTAAEPVFPSHTMQYLAGGITWVCAFLLAFVGWKGPQHLRCLAWAWSGAFLYGLGSGFIKLLTMTWGKWNDSYLMMTFLLSAVGLAVAYGIGGWFIQQGYASGPAPIVVGVMTTVDPVVAVVFGLVVLGEGILVTGLVAVGMLLAAFAAAYGVFALSKHHPEAQRYAGVSHLSDVPKTAE